MSVLATRQDLADHLHETVQNASADLALRWASAQVRNYTEQQLDRVVDDVVTLTSSGGVVRLLERPVISVSQVRVGGNVVADWTLSEDELTHASAWLVDGTAVEVTNTHGYDPLPDDVLGVVLDLAGWRYDNPTALEDEAQDDYRATGQHPHRLTDEHKAILDPYRRRSSSTARASGNAFTIRPGYVAPLAILP